MEGELLEVSEKCENLQKQLNIERAKSMQAFRIDMCDVDFESLSSFKKHKQIHKENDDKFQCNHCERKFDEEWKLKAHVNSHSRVQCKQCDKTFKNSDTLDKHVKISHENIKLFCHFFNKIAFFCMKMQLIVGMVCNVKGTCVCLNMSLILKVT